MTWTKREVETNLVILGDAEGNARKAGGLLASVRPDQRYPDNRRYELVQADGTAKSVAGSASINTQLGVGDVGKFVKLEFEGWGASGNGKFKKIAVQVYEGEPTPEMKAWPRYAELHNGAKGEVASPPEQRGPGPEEEDDDLPF